MRASPNPLGSLALHRIRAEHNERRFYRLDVVVDLFGAVLLIRRWGRIGTDGRAHHEAYADRVEAEAALARYAAAKRRRGYRDYPAATQ